MGVAERANYYQEPSARQECYLTGSGVRNLGLLAARHSCPRIGGSPSLSFHEYDLSGAVVCGWVDLKSKGDQNVLGVVAAVLIVFWLLGFFAFHITNALIHVALLAGLVMLVLQLIRDSRDNEYRSGHP